MKRYKVVFQWISPLEENRSVVYSSLSEAVRCISLAIDKLDFDSGFILVDGFVYLTVNKYNLMKGGINL